MLGFVAALGYEAVSGNSLAVQIKQAPLLIAATFLVFIVASLVRISPLFAISLSATVVFGDSTAHKEEHTWALRQLWDSG